MKQHTSPFKWRHFEPTIILLCVRWYCRYPLSYRDLEEMMHERGLPVDHTTAEVRRGPVRGSGIDSSQLTTFLVSHQFSQRNRLGLTPDQRSQALTQYTMNVLPQPVPTPRIPRGRYAPQKAVRGV